VAWWKLDDIRFCNQALEPGEIGELSRSYMVGKLVLSEQTRQHGLHQNHHSNYDKWAVGFGLQPIFYTLTLYSGNPPIRSVLFNFISKLWQKTIQTTHE